MKLNRKRWPKLLRGLVSLSVLLGVCAILFPLPIASPPQDSPEKDTAEPFPCQNRPCGCRSAEQCWKKCCCFNDAQKVAWAKANDVKVPAFVLVAAKKENEATDGREICSFSAANSSKASGAKPAATCQRCSKKSPVQTGPVCCQKAEASTDDAVVAAKSCSSEPACIEPAKKSAADKSLQMRPSKFRWVLAVSSAECQGLGPPAFCFPTAIIPDRITVVMPTVSLIETILLESERLHIVSLRPPLPPPKIV